MRNEGLFINGVFDSVIREILAVQEHVPEQVLYLQPHSGQRIVKLAENPPSADDPMRLFLSTSDDLPTVRYTCEIVGWDDKRSLAGEKRRIVETVVNLFQPGEGGLYRRMHDNGPECLNLLHVRRMRRFATPFSVSGLFNARDGSPVSPNRSQAGGWVYVRFPGGEWLDSHL